MPSFQSIKSQLAISSYWDELNKFDLLKLNCPYQVSTFGCEWNIDSRNVNVQFLVQWLVENHYSIGWENISGLLTNITNSRPRAINRIIVGSSRLLWAYILPCALNWKHWLIVLFYLNSKFSFIIDNFICLKLQIILLILISVSLKYFFL